MTGFGTRMTEFGTRMTGFGTRMMEFGTRMTGFGTRMMAFGTRMMEFGTRMMAFGTRMTAFGTRMTEFRTPWWVFGTLPTKRTKWPRQGREAAGSMRAEHQQAEFAFLRRPVGGGREIAQALHFAEASSLFDPADGVAVLFLVDGNLDGESVLILTST